MRRGANAIEVALTLPVFVALLSGVLDYGWYFFGEAMAELAAHRGCRAAAAVDPMKGDPGGRAAAVMEGWLSPVGRSCADSTCQLRQEGEIPTLSVVCDVGWPHEALLGAVPVPATIHARASAHQAFQRQ